MNHPINAMITSNAIEGAAVARNNSPLDTILSIQLDPRIKARTKLLPKFWNPVPRMAVVAMLSGNRLSWKVEKDTRFSKYRSRPLMESMRLRTSLR